MRSVERLRRGGVAIVGLFCGRLGASRCRLWRWRLRPQHLQVLPGITEPADPHLEIRQPLTQGIIIRIAPHRGLEHSVGAGHVVARGSQCLGTVENEAGKLRICRLVVRPVGDVAAQEVQRLPVFALGKFGAGELEKAAGIPGHLKAVQKKDADDATDHDGDEEQHEPQIDLFHRWFPCRRQP